VVWSEVVTGPGALVVPPLASQFGESVWIRVKWPDGRVTVCPPRGEPADVVVS
jgi:hypothetical protein